MPQSAPARTTPRCVWMDAGLVRYRLCDRDFDCEHCLLNVALCGEPDSAGRAADHAPVAECLPDDRIYCPGHTWLQAGPDDPTVWRFGLDPFGAATLGRNPRFRWAQPGSLLSTGKPACTIRFAGGSVTLHVPVPCQLARANDALRDHPEYLRTDPCGLGWIAELRITDFGRLPDFLSPTAASDGIRADIARFRHAIAFELLSRVGASIAPLRAGRTLSDLPRLVGARRYRRLLREFVH